MAKSRTRRAWTTTRTSLLHAPNSDDQNVPDLKAQDLEAIHG
ncbi:hypothetical protein ACFY8Z_31520 [Streptomyces microflavus]